MAKFLSVSRAIVWYCITGTCYNQPMVHDGLQFHICSAQLNLCSVVLR